MNLLFLVLVVLLVLAIIGHPGVGVINHSYGWYPSGGLGLVILVILLVLLLR